MKSRYDPAPALAGLKDFQRDTVDHVIDRYFGPNPTRRFLVADETGLGKSVVARGVIARLHDKLQDDPSIKRVDILYICANQDIAEQNLARLQVTDSEHLRFSSRLTLLAKHAHRLRSATATAGKPLNLIAFTPGTSFDKGWRTGQAEERALLFLLLEQALDWDGWGRHAALRALQGTIATPRRFEQRVERLRTELRGRVDSKIATQFRRQARTRKLLRAFSTLLTDIGRRRALTGDLYEQAADLTGQLRTCLARASIDILEPDLVILDEFQRFRHLLDRDEGGEAAELAHDLFDYPQTKVLLLSATPYKPFTYAEEAARGDDHYRDFRRTLAFLCDAPTWNADVTEALITYRDALLHNRPSDTARRRVQDLLLTVMTRTERPAEAQAKLLHERTLPATDLRPAEVRGYATLRKIADQLRAPATVEYWKSAPYFLNFTEGYQLGEKLRSALKNNRDPHLTTLLADAQLLDPASLRSYSDLDLGNARLRAVANDTVEQGWWKLLWIPPSMPHYRPAEPFAAATDAHITKRLVFSSWNATPTAVAGILSYLADQHIFAGALDSNTPEARRKITTRLDFRVENNRPTGMSTLALFWPHPALAELADPLAHARQRPDQLLELADIDAATRRAITTRATPRTTDTAAERGAWAAFLRWPGGQPPGGIEPSRALSALTGAAANAETNEDDHADGGTRLQQHIALALDTLTTAPAKPSDPGELTGELAALATHAPGNIAWRALRRLLDDSPTVTAAGHWYAAATLASAIRSLFNRPDTTVLLDQLTPGADATTYWRTVLRYCAAGGLQATLDEYLHHLRATTHDAPLTDEGLMRLAGHAASAITVRPATYRAFDPTAPDSPIPLYSRFALRYSARSEDSDSARQTEVRDAFNSPFWPFIVTTTSAGQEGIDFHWWCSAVIHWNTPANPVDFEQREGRVHRFGGHAIRRNVAARHRSSAVSSGRSDVWAGAYDAARRESGPLGDFAPYWVYDGDAKIERCLVPYPLSRDITKIETLKRDLALYRLAFGQPRQEDLLTLLRNRGIDQSGHNSLDLRPPRRRN